MLYFKALYKERTYFFNSVFLIFALLVLILLIFDLEFSGSRTTDTLAPVWLFITAGGGIYGIAVFLLLLSAFVLYNFKFSKSKRRVAYLFLYTVFCVQLINTSVTYFVLKDSILKPRPSQLYITGGEFKDPAGVLYIDRLPEERKKYLRDMSENNPDKFKEIYPPLLYNWINETENSFPSGHSQSSFFLAVIFAFIISSTVSIKNKYLTVIPLLWSLLVSLSRVVIGVHYNTDVIAGAFLGIITALAIISIKKFNVLFQRY